MKEAQLIRRTMSILLIAFSLHASTGYSQPHWKWLTNPSGFFGQGLPDPYFLNTQTGFIFSSSIYIIAGDTASRLNRTTDGGIHWTYLEFFDSIGFRIRQIYFITMNHGYAAGSKGIYETFDTGSTWKRISKDAKQYCSVYAAGSSVYAYLFPVPHPDKMNGFFGTLISTSDDGATWHTILEARGPSVTPLPLVPPYVFGNRDSLVFAENYDNQSFRLYCSTDNGKSWISNPFAETIAENNPIGLYCFPHCNKVEGTFITLTTVDDCFTIEETTDFGATWITTLPNREMGPWLNGNNCAIYGSDANYWKSNIDTLLGPLRSLHGGENWTFHTYPNGDGPTFVEIDDQTSNLSGAGPGDFTLNDWRNISSVGGGAVIYAADCNYVLWKSTDGGDGTLSASALASKLDISNDLVRGNPDTLYGGICDTAFMTVAFQNISCNYAQFLGMHFDELDSTEFTTVLRHHQLCDGLSDTLLIRIYPRQASPIRNLNLHLQFVNDEYEVIDTGFSFILKGSASAGSRAVRFWSARIINDSLNVTISLPIYFHRSAVVNDVDMIMHYPTQSLKYLSGVTYNGNSLDMNGSRWPGRASLHFTAADLNAAPDSLLGYAKFLWTPYEFDCDHIEFDSIQTIGDLCDGSPKPFEGIIGSYKTCGASFVESHAFNSSLDFSMSPNPASNTVGIVLTNTSASCEYQLFDALGIILRKGIIGGGSLQLNTSDIPAGSYYLRISSREGAPVTKRIVIVR